MTKGEKIKYLRHLAGMSQTDLAKRIGVSKQTLYKYENDIITNIPSDKIEAIAQTTGNDPEYIMGWKELEELAKAKTQDDMLLDLFHKLNDEGKKTAMVQLEILTMMDDFKEDKSG